MTFAYRHGKFRLSAKQEVPPGYKINTHPDKNPENSIACRQVFLHDDEVVPEIKVSFKGILGL